ncbi:MAG TPA: hypothetical protein DCS20_03190 [Candidatus Yonathbacteria bacterium]|nr:hypothetical protein [Candidatus Yonathbacteria bacterium]
MQYQLPIIDRKEVAENTTEVTFGTEGTEAGFKAGQHLSLNLPELLFPDPKGSSRYFSMVSSPHTKDSLSIVFRNSESGFKKTLLSLPLGTKVEVDCCHGSFIVPEGNTLPLVLIAGGVGVAPCMSIIRTALAEKAPYQITLVYGSHNEAGAAYLAEIKELAAQNPSFILKTIFGPLDQDALIKNIDFEIESEWFIVGPSDMVESVWGTLKKNNISDARIHAEEFAGYKSASMVETGSTPQSTEGISALDLQGILQSLDKLVILSATDTQGNITYVNNKFIEISKYSRSEILGQNHRILKSGTHSPEFYEKLWRTISSGETWRGIIKNKAKDGSFYWVDASIAPVFDTQGEIVRYVAARFPITEQKELEEKTKMFSKVIEGTSQAWGIADLDGMMVSANSAFVNFFGYNTNELSSINYMNLVNPEYRDLLMQGLDEMQKTKKSLVAEVGFTKKDGSPVFANLTVDFYYDENGAPQHIYAFLNDITKQKETEAELKEHNKEIENLNKLMIGRELKMVELKEALKKAQGEIEMLKTGAAL